MDINAIDGMQQTSRYVNRLNNTETSNVSFDSMFESAKKLISETNELSNKAEEEEIKFAMGTSDSITDLQVAQQKANLSLQYTVAVRNTVLEIGRASCRERVLRLV